MTTRNPVENAPRTPLLSAVSLVYPATLSWMFLLRHKLPTAYLVPSIPFLAIGCYFVGTFVGAKLHVREIADRVQLWGLAITTAVASALWSGALLVAASRATSQAERQELRIWFAAGVCGAATALLLGLFVGMMAARSKSWETLDRFNFWVWVSFLLFGIVSLFII